MKQLASVTLLSIASLSLLSAEGAQEAPSAVAVLHSRMITPASDTLFQAESTPPSTAQAWEKVRASAAELAHAAARLASKDLARDPDQWTKFAQALKSQAEQAIAAAQKKDQDALVMANGNIVSVCEDCHAKYRDAGRSMKQ